VSDVPGTTRDVVAGTFQWRGTAFRLLDTAGLRRRTHVSDAVEYYSAARARETVRACDLVFLVIDAVEGLGDQDKKIAALSAAEGRGLLFVLNKWDLVGRKAGLASEARERVRFQFPVLAYAPVLTVSARTGAGVSRLLETALEVHGQLTRRAGTGRLNQALAGWVAHNRPPGRSANYRIRYLVQVSANPVRFAAFVNRLAGFPASYTQYLENCIRRDFGMPNVPVAIELRQSPRTAR